MRVSIVNCVSTAVDMMRFSDVSLFSTAGHNEFDYIVVKWLASQEVEEYLAELPSLVRGHFPDSKVHIVEHLTNDQIGYVPNLRAMMNKGFQAGFQLNEYCGLTNTDVYHGPGWLSGLVKYVDIDRVISSLHITAVPLNLMNFPKAGIVNEDLGIPEPGKFNLDRFQEIYQEQYQDKMLLAWQAAEMGGRGGFRQVHTMPYLFHRKWWNRTRGWPLTFDWEHKMPPPDETFFSMLESGGCEFALSHASIIYHSEGVERKRTRPPGAEHLTEE